MIAISRTVKGWISQAARRMGLPSRADLARFWRFLTVNNLVGSVESPVASKVDGTAATAASAVRNVLDRAPTGRR
jgi:hypothetical protein